MSITSSSSSDSSIHTNIQTTVKSLAPDVDIPTHAVLALPIIMNCYNCHNTGHFTALCRRPCNTKCTVNTTNKCGESRGRSQRSASRRRRHTYRSTSHGSSSSRYSSASHSLSQDHHWRRSPQRRHSPTPYMYQVSHIMSFNSYSNEDQLYTDRAPDGQRSFHTTLQLVTKQGSKALPVKVDPGTGINTIPLSHYKTLFPNHFTRDGQLKKNALRSTTSTWSLYDGTTKQFLRYFTIDVQYKTSPQTIPLSFYIFGTFQDHLHSYPTPHPSTWA